MNANTVAERVSELRARRKEEGLVKLELWVHENDVTRVKMDAAAHAARRARVLKEHGVVIDSHEAEQARLVKTARKRG